MKSLIHSGAKFLLVGGLSTLIEVTLFNLFLLWGLDPVAAKVAASLIALANAYFGNREWAFRHRRGRSRLLELVYFLAVNAVCTALGAVIVAAGVAALDAPGPLLLNVVNLVSIAIVVVVRFALYHFVVFRAPADRSREPDDDAVRTGAHPSGL
jgi:putative flippase GtrA